MSSLKISQLTATTTNTIGSWVIVNNSGETVSNKSQLEYVLGLTKGSGISSIKSNDFLTDLPSEASTDYSIALGNGASASTAPSIVAIGNGAYSVSENCVVIGKNAHDQGTGRDDGIAIGTDAEIYQARAISIGKDAAGVTDAISIGTSSRGIGTATICIGASTTVAGNNGVGIGYDIFQDRDNASVVGAQSYVSGANSTVVGASNGLGQNGGDSENSVVVGVSNQIYGPFDKAIAIGYGNTIKSDGTIVISSAGISGLENSNNSTVIGTSGFTVSSNFGSNNVMIGGLSNTVSNPLTKTTIIGGESNNFNSVGGDFTNVVALGLSGRTLNPISATTLVESLYVFGTIRQNFQTYIDAGQIDINPGQQGFIEVVASGGTYDLNITPAPNDIGDTISLFITYTSGATINFVGGGNVQWRFNENIAPTFSAATTSRSILVFNTWDGNDMWEVSRSMNMV